MLKLSPPLLISVLAFFLLFFFCGASACGAASLDPQEVEAFLDGILAQQKEEFNFTGATLALVKEGEVVLKKGYGYADLEDRTPVDPGTTLFRPGSVSKLLTWTAVMQLVEEGKLDLEADVSKYLDFEIPGPMLQGSKGEPEPITLHHLMTHTPGFEDRGEGLFLLSREKMLPLGDYLKAYMPERVFPPGEILAYSNYGTALAGYIVERVSGLPFATYVEENIFQPLGMDHSTFRQPPQEHVEGEMARAYNYVGGEYHEGTFEYVQGKPAGSMSSTASDLASFMLAHLQGGYYQGERILEEETTRQMHRQQFTHHPSLEGVCYGFFEATYNGRRVITHGGDTILFHSGLYLLPQEELGLFVSYNGGNVFARESLFQAFMDRYYPQPYTPAPPPPQGALERALPYTGEYHPLRRSFTTLEKILVLMQPIHINVQEEGYLVASYFGETEQYVEVEPGIYTSRRVEGTNLISNLVFAEDERGQVILYSDGSLTFSQAPWYGTASFTGFLLLVILLFLTGT
ncbi:MAG: class C beta-lactamase-related serine hydrolase, partial [Candidatus Syntrophonatronum acetioxidans]